MIGKLTKFSSSHQRCSVRKGVLRNFTKFKSLTQVFSCEFCEISKNTFFTEQRWVIASANCANRGKCDKAAASIEGCVHNLIEGRALQKAVYITFHQEKFVEIQWLRLSLSSYFKPLYERSNEQFLSQNPFYLSFYPKKKIGKYKMFLNFLRTTDKRYQ